MKTIVYHSDGAIVETASADAIVASGAARFATDAERSVYLRGLALDDARICGWCDESPDECGLNECPYRETNWPSNYSHAAGYQN